MNVGASTEIGAKPTRTVARSGSRVGGAADEARAASVAAAVGGTGAGAHATRHHHTPTRAATLHPSLACCLIALPTTGWALRACRPCARTLSTRPGSGAYHRVRYFWGKMGVVIVQSGAGSQARTLGRARPDGQSYVRHRTDAGLRVVVISAQRNLGKALEASARP